MHASDRITDIDALREMETRCVRGQDFEGAAKVRDRIAFLEAHAFEFEMRRSIGDFLPKKPTGVNITKENDKAREEAGAYPLPQPFAAEERAVDQFMDDLVDIIHEELVNYPPKDRKDERTRKLLRVENGQDGTHEYRVNDVVLVRVQYGKTWPPKVWRRSGDKTKNNEQND